MFQSKHTTRPARSTKEAPPLRASRIDLSAKLASIITANLEAHRKALETLLAHPWYDYQQLAPRLCEALMPAMRKYGVYHFFIIGEDGAITSMYVGESHTATEKSGLHNRIRQHINPGGDETGNLADSLVRAGDAANRHEAVEIIRESFQLQYLVLTTPPAVIEQI
jgi:hypothetical protein